MISFVAVHYFIQLEALSGQPNCLLTMKPVISFFKTVENSVNIPLRSRLSLSSMLTSFNACGFPNDVEKAKQFWLEKLCQKNVPEAELSIDHFLAHILGLQSVITLN